MKYILFTFKQTKDAIIADKLLNNMAISMPVLREISADCGIALKISLENKEKAISIISKNIDTTLFNIYEISGFGNSKSITFIQ